MAGLPKLYHYHNPTHTRFNQRSALKQVIAASVLIILISTVFQFSAFSSQNQKSSFSTRLASAHPDDVLSALIYVNTSSHPRKTFLKRSDALVSLNSRARSSQERIMRSITDKIRLGGVRKVRPFWIINAILVEGSARALRDIENHSDVKILKENFILSLPETHGGHHSGAPGSYEWGLEKIQVHRVWESYGFKGDQIRIGHLDTGVHESHPDLSGKIAAWAVIDQFGNIIRNESPADSGSHGTHTAGIIVGGSHSGSAIGVAPEAMLLSARVVDGHTSSFAQVLAGLEWVIDPDGDPLTDDGADIVNLSLGASGQYEEFIEPVSNLIEANIFPSFSIGNSGIGTSASPGNLPDSTGVGAIDIENEAAFFSSGEVVEWNIDPYIGVWIKPDVCAPGVDIKSSVPGGYSWLSGTSMAAPFVSGTVALIRQANPGLSVKQIQTVLAITARDLGSIGKDTRYGWGAIDAYGAVSLALSGDIPDELGEFTPETPWAYIMSPRNGQSVWGDAVTVLAGATQHTSRVLFQYKQAAASPSSDWITIGTDASGPFSLYWNVTGLAPATYCVRACPIGTDGTTYSATSGITVEVNAHDPDIFEYGGSRVDPLEPHQKTEHIRSGVSADVIVADGTRAIIPAGSVSGDTSLIINHLGTDDIAHLLPPRESSLQPIGIFREFIFKNGEHLFPNEVTIFLPYVDADRDGIIDGTSIHEEDLRVYYLKKDAHGTPEEWVMVSDSDYISSFSSPEYNGYAQTGGKALGFLTDHFTLFAIMGHALKNNLSEILVYPNPVRGGSSSLFFKNLTPDTQLKIFTLAGRMVRKVNDLNDSYTWDCTNTNGEQVVSGIYIYLVTNNKGDKAKGKFAIIK